VERLGGPAAQRRSHPSPRASAPIRRHPDISRCIRGLVSASPRAPARSWRSGRSRPARPRRARHQPGHSRAAAPCPNRSGCACTTARSARQSHRSRGRPGGGGGGARGPGRPARRLASGQSPRKAYNSPSRHPCRPSSYRSSSARPSVCGRGSRTTPTPRTRAGALVRAVPNEVGAFTVDVPVLPRGDPVEHWRRALTGVDHGAGAVEGEV
jgi:hypothetical protein